MAQRMVRVIRKMEEELMGIKKGKIKITKKPVSGGPGGFKPTSDGPSEGD
jgi:hypothetical protein